MESKSLVSVSVAMPADLAYRARIRAAIEGVSRSLFVRKALERALSEDIQRPKGTACEVRNAEP